MHRNVKQRSTPFRARYVLVVVILALLYPQNGAAYNSTLPNNWVRIALSGDVPGQRRMHGLAAADGLLYLYGGFKTGGNYMGKPQPHEDDPAKAIPD